MTDARGWRAAVDRSPELDMRLNCREPAYDDFRRGDFDPAWIGQSVFSFGMITLARRG